jgi:hypothetical protein
VHDWERKDLPEELLRAVAAELRRPVRVSAALDARVMAEIRRAPKRRGLGALWGWLRQPRTFTLTPLAGFAAAGAVALLVLAVALGGRVGAPGGAEARVALTPAATAPDEGAPRRVQFVIVAPSARSVALVGDFNDWEIGATPLRAAAGRIWTVEIPLEPGRHRYAFVVDGREWMADPAAPSAPGDDFGQPSSVVTVSDADRRSA